MRLSIAPIHGRNSPLTSETRITKFSARSRTVPNPTCWGQSPCATMCAANNPRLCVAGSCLPSVAAVVVLYCLELWLRHPAGFQLGFATRVCCSFRLARSPNCSMSDRLCATRSSPSERVSNFKKKPPFQRVMPSSGFWSWSSQSVGQPCCSLFGTGQWNHSFDRPNRRLAYLDEMPNTLILRHHVAVSQLVLTFTSFISSLLRPCSL